MSELTRLKQLAPDQLDILGLLAQGTVRRKVRAVANELGVDSTIEAVVWAVRQRLI